MKVLFEREYDDDYWKYYFMDESEHLDTSPNGKYDRMTLDVDDDTYAELLDKKDGGYVSFDDDYNFNIVQF